MAGPPCTRLPDNPVSFRRMTACNPSLDGKVVLITGGARRVGAEIARTLHGAGACVLIHYRSSAQAASDLAQELNRARPGTAAVHSADLLSAEAPETLVNAAIRAFGGVDVLINNASSFAPSTMGEITRAQWNDLIGTNLQAPLFLAQAAVPSLAERRGLIINIVDIHGLRPLKGYPVYSVAKAGLAMLTRSLARELGPEIRVNGIAPGPVLWPEHDIDEALKREIIGKTALQRHGNPTDVARTALFLAQDAPYITGQIIAVDGGRGI
jgi:pteridine reductase